MFQYFFGLVLFGLGFWHHSPNVLGAQSALQVLTPVMTKTQEDAFQKDRAAREAKLQSVTAARLAGIQKAYVLAQLGREQKDKILGAAFTGAVSKFTDSVRQKKVMAISTAFQAVVNGTLTDTEKKLEDLSALLDKISAAEAALKDQGKDVSGIDSDINAGQAKLATAFTLSQQLAGSLSSVLPVTDEANAGAEVRTALGETKSQLLNLNNAFVAARSAVGVALTDVEAATKPVAATPTP